MKELRKQPENEPTYVCKKHLNFEEGVYNPNQAFKDLIKVELLKKALKTEPRITEQLQEEISEEIEKMTYQTVKIYEHPWVYKYQGILFEQNKSVYDSVHKIAAVQTSFALLQFFMGNYLQAFVNGMAASLLFQGGPGGVNPINITAAQIEIVRLIRDGVKDDKASFVIVTTMGDKRVLFSSRMIQPFDLQVIKQRPILRTLISSYYPVWMGAYGYRILRYGKVLDRDLFRAVLNGKRIDLSGTVKFERTQKEKKEKEAEEKAKLDEEIREILKERNRPIANLEEGGSESDDNKVPYGKYAQLNF